MSEIIKLGKSGLVGFVVYCEDGNAVVKRMGVTEIRLPTEGAEELTLEIHLNNVNGEVSEEPLHKADIRHIELRVVTQEKDPDTETVITHAVKHLFLVNLKRIETDLEVYTVTRWVTYVDGKVTLDIDTATVIELNETEIAAFSFANELQEEFLRIAKEHTAETPTHESVSKILSGFAAYSRRLYMELWRELNNTPCERNGETETEETDAYMGANTPRT